MKNLEALITKANALETVQQMADFADDMISQYAAGKQEAHRRRIKVIMAKYTHGIGRTATIENWAREQLMKMIGNVCLTTKVL